MIDMHPADHDPLPVRNTALFHNEINRIGSESGCPHEEMVDQFARFSLPGRDPSMPIEDRERYPVHIPGTNIYVGDIETRITDGGLTIENRTKAGHIFSMAS